MEGYLFYTSQLPGIIMGTYCERFGSSAEEVYEFNERLGHAKIILDTLSSKEQLIFFKRLEGHSQREIGDIIGTSSGWIGTLEKKIKKKIGLQAREIFKPKLSFVHDKHGGWVK